MSTQHLFKAIVTHPGSSHKDEFLACCTLLAENPVPVQRHEPTESELADPAIAVVDVGHLHEPARSNFDHHQFPADAVPRCALSLVLDHLGLYADAREFCAWLEPAEWFDCRGPNQTAIWLGTDRETLDKLISPIDITLLRRFARATELNPGDPLWEVMRWIGEDLLHYLRNLRARMDFLEGHTRVWSVPMGEQDEVPVLFLPRTNPLPTEPAEGLVPFAKNHLPAVGIRALVYPDRRCEGYALSRYEDTPDFDFSRLTEEPDVHFAHARGFVAKTSATDLKRLRTLIQRAWAG